MLGVPVTFRASSKALIERVRAAYPERPLQRAPLEPALDVSLIEDASLDSGPGAAVSVEILPQDVLALDGGGVTARADGRTGRAHARLSPAAIVAADFREAILDHLTLFLVTRRDRCPLHAGAIVRGQRALLLAGPSGVGKSSLTYAAMRSGFQILADDAVYVQGDPSTRLWGMPPRIHVPRPAGHLFPELRGAPAVARPDGRSKIAVPVSGAQRATAPFEGLTGLCLLKHSRADEGPRRLSMTEAIEDMRTTLQGGFHRFRAELDDCVRRVAIGGAWRVPVTVEPHELVRRVEALMAELGT